MSRRKPQRDINLAQRATTLMSRCLEVQSAVLSPDDQDDMRYMLSQLENSCLDMIGFIREYKRKISPIEVKGQRG